VNTQEHSVETWISKTQRTISRTLKRLPTVLLDYGKCDVPKHAADWLASGEHTLCMWGSLYEIYLLLIRALTSLYQILPISALMNYYITTCINNTYFWFQIFTVFWILYVFFWALPRRQIKFCRRFGTLCQVHLQRLDEEEIPKRKHTKYIFYLTYRILHLVTHFVDLTAGMYQLYSTRMTEGLTLRLPN
jgi:hypothetical protein